MTIPALLAATANCFVGSNVGSSDLQALHVLECDTETGAARIVQSVNGLQGTTYFQQDPSGQWLYSAIAEDCGGKRSGAAVRFRIEDGCRIGAMERLAGLPCETPCHVSLSPDGTRLFTAAYTSATLVTLGTDGKGLATVVLPDDDMGSNRKRQRKAFAHYTFMTPDAKRLGVIDLGCDRIRFFDPVTLAPDLSLEIKCDRGDGPRHAVWSKDGRRLFVVNELGSSVSSYAFDGSRFARIGKWSMLPVGFSRWEPDGETLSTKAAAIKLTADGRILMASNRGYDSIAFYEVGGDGKLSLKNIAKLTGSFPRDFELMPGERFMVVGHKMSNTIQVYRFDRDECTLMPIGEPIPCWRPLCFKFAR